MILTHDYVLAQEKLAIDIKIGDILKRVDDNFFYKLENITYNEHGKDHNFHFYGFVIKGMKNLKLYFKMNKDLFQTF